MANEQGDAGERRKRCSLFSSPLLSQRFSIPNRQNTGHGKRKYVIHLFGQHFRTQRKLVWRGAAPQGRKRHVSFSPPRASQSAKKAKRKFCLYSAFIIMQLIFFLPNSAIASVASCQARQNKGGHPHQRHWPIQKRFGCSVY
jgi:hypothetical protein